jgi:hypothetical protein
MEKVYQDDSKRYSYAVYLSKGVYYISNEFGTRKATKKEVKRLKANL